MTMRRHDPVSMVLPLAALALAAGPCLAPAGAALAANADQPHANVDRRNDAGNATGNERVDQLNAAQRGTANPPGNPPAPPLPPAPPNGGASVSSR
ncbi:hypothetical protein M0638_02710 [Roseomonas sp. NAR14]|uniref:Uncharacterized protein n=1 Tax=Roseomonas acroporae TaxID=2937791 RepID=A0A9X1Y547_9PROT|nr:hypothetical protein [Roseomonas acroporae]MCK8783292.1 hypothetical protein [Roseomonas acroporae]